MESRYLLERRALKLKGPKTAKEEKADAQAKGDFYRDQAAQAPKKCEECGQPLAGTMAINPAAVVAHILPKRREGGCPSVALHKNNRFFACGNCHTNYDQKGATYVQNMSIFEVLKKRVATFYHLIPENEVQNVPAYFRPEEKKVKHGSKKKPGGKNRKPAKKGK
jgi:5-methylcytosine-specific restriction endonuclease McrA